ncbi:MAG: sensor histidine kinase [Pseudonocardia sp.]
MDRPGHPSRWSDLLPAAALPAVVGTVVLAGSFAAAGGQPEARTLDSVGVALLLVGPIALMFRRRYPPAVFAVAAAAAIGYLGLGYPYGPVFLPSLVALATAVTAGYRGSAYILTGLAYGTLVALHMARSPGGGVPLGGALGWLAGLVAFVAGCELWRSRRERLAQARANEVEAQRRRGSEERLRIARELHDVLGHHVSLINVQAGVALYLMDSDPGQARDALAAIKQSSGVLLQEMRSTLGVLRGADEEPPRHPVAGLARLDDLVADNRAAGLPVTVDVRGVRRELPPSVDLAAYRIVQEALTNTRRHAAATGAAVLLDYGEAGLTVQVDDDGNGPGPGGPAGTGNGGSGLPGMRERATALGGSLAAGSRAGGGFQVRARLPIVSRTATSPAGSA